MTRSKGELSLRELCLYALLGALLFAAKMVLAPFPNIEPVSLLVMVMAVVLGWKGMIPLYLYIACELFVWGIGLWSISYLYVWLILFCLARLFSSGSPLSMAVLASLFGFSFGALCALPVWLSGGWQAALSWWQSGVLFDLIHGISNFFIVLVLYRPLKKTLERLMKGMG